MSLLCHLSFIVFLVSLFTRTRAQTDNVTEHITIKKQGDGPMLMSSGKGESQDSFTDWQLDMDLVKILEGSERRLEFSGVLKDGVTNRTAECSSSKSDVIEEKRKLLRIFCPKEGDERLILIPKSVWAANADNGSLSPEDEDLFQGYRTNLRNTFSHTERRTKQAELLLVTLHFPLWTNFFIESDGRVFEGFGWDNVSYGYSGGLGDRALIVGFADGKMRGPNPSEAAVRAYEKLVRYAICTRRLSTDFVPIPYYLIWDISHSTRNAENNTDYEKIEMMDWNGYTNDVDFLFPLESDLTHRVISRQEWSGLSLNAETYALETPAELLVVYGYGPRCFSHCDKYFRWLEDGNIKGLGNAREFLLHNFFIAEDGRVYERLGWRHTKEGNERKYISFFFIGTFAHYPPRQSALDAMNNLIAEGLRIGKISPEYRITTSEIPQGLKGEISKMDTYVDESVSFR